MKKYLTLKALSVMVLISLAGCGKQGPLEYPEETNFPRSYPAPE
jgi:predicted small lipoprotein YifL